MQAESTSSTGASCAPMQQLRSARLTSEGQAQERRTNLRCDCEGEECYCFIERLESSSNT
jgi:hypothetical protein